MTRTKNSQQSDSNPITFAFNEVCGMCIQAGIGRIGTIYKKQEDKVLKDVEHSFWRKRVIEQLRSELMNGYSGSNIDRIGEFIEKTKDNTLKDGKLDFGVAQKILNLFLKYCWSLGWTKDTLNNSKPGPEPEDCPIDRYILKHLKLPYDANNSWSKMNKDAYRKVMNEVDVERKKQNKSRAKWEFDTWPTLKEEQK